MTKNRKVAKYFVVRSRIRTTVFAALIISACKAETPPEQVVVPLIEERLQAPVDRQLIEVRIDPPGAPVPRPSPPPSPLTVDSGTETRAGSDREGGSARASSGSKGGSARASSKGNSTRAGGAPTAAAEPAPEPPAPRVDRRTTELAGLVTALFESGLADLEDVIPRVGTATISPGLTPTIRSNLSRWTVDLQLADGLESDEFDMAATICSEVQAACELFASTGERARPEFAVAQILEETAHVLGRFPLTGTSTAWRTPQSDDAYAVILAGRAAATFYGLLPAPPPEVIGDRRRDPVERALFVDPDMPIASWIAGRRRLALNLPVLAHSAFARASELRPSSVLFAADAARALTLAGEHEDALAAWGKVRARDGNDPRFSLGRAQGLLSAGHADRALTELDALPIVYHDDPSAVALRVAVEDALGDSRDREDLLLLWQEVAAHDPEPVRRRITRRVDQRNYPEALLLVDELARRGAAAEASRLAVALALGTHDYARAEKELETLGWATDLAHLRARMAFEKDPTSPLVEVPEESDPLAIVFAANAHTARGHYPAALAEVDRALQIQPYMAEALSLRYQILAALGRRAEAEAALALLTSADPYYPRPVPPSPIAPPPNGAAAPPVARPPRPSAPPPPPSE